MKTFIDRLLRNPITFEITSIFVYAFYCLVFATAAVPSVFLIHWGTGFLDGSYLMLMAFTLICFIGFYLFLLVSSIFVGFVERLLTFGFKPGAYSPGSPVFFRWLIYSGLHLWMVKIVLTFLRGNNWIKIYMRVAGAKVGKETFINTCEIYDTYMVEIGNEVLIGGEAFLNAHLFENGSLNIGKIIIGDGATIGANAYLTPGTRIGRGSTVGMYTYLRRNTDVNDGEALIAPPGMSVRQVIKLMRSKDRKASS